MKIPRSTIIVTLLILIISCYVLYEFHSWISGIENNPSSVSAEELVSYVSIKELKTQIALDKYRTEEGAYPKTLAELIPRYLKEISNTPVKEVNVSYERVSTTSYKLCMKLSTGSVSCGSESATMEGKTFNSYSNP
ncbi:MAG: hypothetical protein ABIT47_00730 [Candidatus Paceibacterota bacterium]